MDAHKSLRDGAIRMWPAILERPAANKSKSETTKKAKAAAAAKKEDDELSSADIGGVDSVGGELAGPMLEAMCKAMALPMDVAVDQLTSGQRRLILYGTGDRWFEVETQKGIKFEFQWKGLMPALEQAARLSPTLRNKLGPFIAEVPCSACDGSRLNIDASAARFRGLTIGDYTQGTLKWLHSQLGSWKLDAREQEIAGELVRRSAHGPSSYSTSAWIT